MKKTITMILCLVLTLSMLAGCTVVNVAKIGTVNGEDIPLGVYKYAVKIAEMYLGQMDYEDALTNIAMYDSYTASLVYSAIDDVMADADLANPDEKLWDRAYGETTLGEAVKTAVANEIAKVYVAAEKAVERELALAAEETAAIDTMKSNLYSVLGTKTAFDAAISEINLTANQLTALWTKILLASKLNEAVSGEQEITDEAIATYFNDNYMRVKHILVKIGDEGIDTMEVAKAKAEAILAELAEGGNFEELMNTHSGDVDEEGNVRGGEEGYVFKEGDFGNPAFEDASKALAVGEYTKELVEVNGSYQGYHIIKRYEMSEGYFEENKEALTETIKATLGNEAYEAYLEGVAGEADVKLNNSKIKGVKLIKIKAE